MKRLARNMIIIVAVLMLASSVFADRGLELVTDDANLLTEIEYQELNDRANEISEKYKCNIAIVTMEDMGNNAAYQFAKGINEEYEMGYGDEKSVLLLFLSMKDRDYALIAHGYGNMAFTDYGKDTMLEDYILPLLGEGKYFKAFSEYLNLAEEYLELAKNGNPFDIDTNENSRGLALPIKLGITFIIPIIIAAIICGIWKSQMKTAKLATTAGNYINADGLKLTKQQDLFLYRTESRKKIEKKSSGGTTTDKSGTSGRSGKF